MVLKSNRHVVLGSASRHEEVDTLLFVHAGDGGEEEVVDCGEGGEITLKFTLLLVFDSWSLAVLLQGV